MIRESLRFIWNPKAMNTSRCFSLWLRLYLWPHRIMYLGLSPENDLHRHHAAQLCVSLDATLKISQPEAGETLEVSGVFIPPDHPHRIEAGDSRILALYLEPESDEYQPLLQPLRTDVANAFVPLQVSAAGLTDLRRLLAAGANANFAWSTCQTALGLGSSTVQSIDRDPRIEQVISIIRGEPGRSHSAEQLAAAVHISPSRLIHLFREQVGIPIRRFTVWSRLRQVVHLSVDGATLTEAAHAAGFSDAAHMSNTFRKMFGFAPSVLFTARVPKDVHVLD